MRFGVEADQEIRPFTNVLERVRDACRDGEADCLTFGHYSILDLFSISQPNPRGAIYCDHFRAKPVVVISTNAARFRQNHVHIALCRQGISLYRLEHPATRVLMDGNLFNNNSHEERICLKSIFMGNSQIIMCGHEEPSMKLLDQVLEIICRRYCSIRAEQACVDWAKRFTVFHGKRQPKDMREKKISQYISYLADNPCRPLGRSMPSNPIQDPLPRAPQA
jgi:hypothetical protein